MKHNNGLSMKRRSAIKVAAGILLICSGVGLSVAEVPVVINSPSPECDHVI